jgi:hypothetical protein
MDCRVVINSLSDFVDRGLPVDEVRLVEEHLTGCKRCQTTRDELDGLRRAASELPLHTPGPTLWLRIRAEVEAELGSMRAETPTEPASWWRRLWDRKISFTLPQFAGAGVLAAAVMISGGYLLRESIAQKQTISPRDAVASLLPPESAELLKRQISEFNSRKVTWDPTMRADFEHHIQQIDQSLAGCRGNLERNPADPIQREMYRVLVDEKIRLLKDSSRLKW